MIGAAVRRIGQLLGQEAALSAVIESEPWGYESPNPFLNQGLMVEVGNMEALELHRLLQGVQMSLCAASHRTDTGEYCDRAIDIDFIALGQTVVDTPGLILPHPRMHLREFVLRPMAELDPEWIHPLLGLSPPQMLALLENV